MIVGVNSVDDGSARVAMLGIGHSVAYLAGRGGAVRHAAGAARPPAVPALLLARAVPDLGGARRARRGAPSARSTPGERVATAAVLAVIGVLGVGLYVAMLRMLPKRPALREAALEPTDPDLAVEL